MLKVISERAKITRTTIEGAWRRRAPGQRLDIRDTECPGLVLIVNATTMRWQYGYRPRGLDPATGKRWQNKNISIGNPTTHSPDDARAEANRIKGQVVIGRDPVAERKAEQAAVNQAKAETLGRLRDRYAAILPTRPKLRGTGLRSAGHIATELGNLTSALAAIKAETLPATDLTAILIRRATDDLSGMPGAARHRFGSLNRFCDWLLEEGIITANPCATVPKSRRPKAVAARGHFLAPADLALIWQAADVLLPVQRDFIRFLIATSCRRDEAASLDWQAINLDGATWTQREKTTKNDEPHRFHLHGLALDILRQRHADAGQPRAGLVFPAPRSGKAIGTFNSMKKRLDQASGIAGWRQHDIRRSFVTALAEAGVAEPVADAILNHKQAATRGGVLGVYQRAARWPEQVRAMTLWGDILDRALNPQAVGAEVVPIGRKQRG